MFGITIKLFSICLTFIFFSFFVGVYSSNDWDILIFTQHWPLTVCWQWKEKQEQHSCKLPSKASWTIHGIWPTKLGTEGPGFCNKSLHFNAESLKPIQKDLLIYWPDVFNGSVTGLWKHEWIKHGTCAVVLPALDTEIKYFKKGLEWMKMYSMLDILSGAGIHPNEQGYPVQEVWKAITGSLGKNPDIQCVKDKKSGKWLILEIRVCFDKSLQLVNCNGVKTYLEKNSSKILTNCPLSEAIIYPSKVPDDAVCRKSTRPRAKWLLKFLQIIQLVQWITL